MNLFFIVFFALYTLINFYIGLRGWQSLEAYSYLRSWYLIFFIYMASSYIISKIFQKQLPDLIYMILETSGSFWFAMMLYFFIAIVLVDISRLAGFKYTDYNQAKALAFSAVILLTLIIMAVGFYNTRNPILRKLDVTIKTKGDFTGVINAVLISDIHLSTINNDRFARQLTDRINALNPDIVFIAGDLVDDKADYLKRYGIGYAFKDLNTRYGVYGITGNHEYINGIESCIRYMRELGITVLSDTSITIDNKFILAGREDRTKNQFMNNKRKELGVILEDRDDLPVILLDHTPFGLDDAINNKVDLQLSGHTHHGQLFPLNYITSLIYEASTGYHKRGNTQFYISSGVGTWGPPIRTGSRSEIVNLKISFSK